MITNEDGEGIFRFDTVGSIDVRYIVGKPVLVGRDHIPGVIGAKPIHLVNHDEIKNAPTLENLRIDVGLNSAKVKPGDRVAFAVSFKRLGVCVLGKALDNRLGVAILIELLKDAPPHLDLLASFSVQEEIGLRGARVAAHALNPDLAIAVDATPAYDLPAWDGSENVSYNTRLGAGPALYVASNNAFSDPRLLRHFIKTADACQIPYQLRQPGGGGTNAGAIHKQRLGIPSISVSTPHRYSHTPASIARLEDWRNTLALVQAALLRLSPQELSVER
jgi:endoglucanase